MLLPPLSGSGYAGQPLEQIGIGEGSYQISTNNEIYYALEA
jgi:hypothetical protein